MRILICGDRDYTNERRILYFVKTLPADTVVIHNGSRGAGKIAADAATARRLKVETYEADWDHYKHTTALTAHNKRLIEESRPDAIVVFHPNIKTSRCTLNMTQCAYRMSVRTIINPSMWE